MWHKSCLARPACFLPYLHGNFTSWVNAQVNLRTNRPAIVRQQNLWLCPMTAASSYSKCIPTNTRALKQEITTYKTWCAGGYQVLGSNIFEMQNYDLHITLTHTDKLWYASVLKVNINISVMHAQWLFTEVPSASLYSMKRQRIAEQSHFTEPNALYPPWVFIEHDTLQKFHFYKMTAQQSPLTSPYSMTDCIRCTSSKHLQSFAGNL